MRRVDEPEWMDAPGVPRARMVRVLSDLRHVNRFFGGAGPILRALLPALRACARRPVRILDIAGGDGFVLRQIVDRARREDIAIQGVVLDQHPVVLSIAEEACRGYPEIRVDQGDALALDYPDDSFDFTLSCLALHHFGPEGAARAIREMDRVAAEGLVINDLRRTRAAYLTTVAALTLLGCDPITRHDGPASVRRAFTRAEYAAILQAAGVPDLSYRECLWFRAIITRTPGKGAGTRTAGDPS